LSKKPKIILLCGGKGERLRPLTVDIPKPLIQINKKPIISYIFEHLESFNIDDFIIATGYKADKIHSYMQELEPSFSYKTVYSGDADIIQRIKDSSKHIDTDFLVLYGDTLTDLDVDKLIKFHKQHSQPVTISVWPLKTQFGLVETDSNNKVISFKEKPTLDKWINIGYFYFDRDFMNVILQYSSFVSFLNDAAKKGIISAYKHEGVHITINTLRELDEAEDQLNKIVKEIK
tara:strand:+ start:48401 stop:49096 length:696 start_codon:yes stop_codon:yes gene_type:complete